MVQEEDIKEMGVDGLVSSKESATDPRGGPLAKIIMQYSQGTVTGDKTTAQGGGY